MAGKSYLYIPRTYVKFDAKKIEILEKLAKAENSIFIRIEPVKQNLYEFGFKKIKSVQPQKTLVLDLSKSEDDLLMAMHQKTRYNIRLADKRGVKIEQSQQEQFPRFYDLIVSTYRRKKKKHFNRDYYHKQFQSNLTKIYYAEYQKSILAANMIVFYGDTVTYLHGGTSHEHKNVMAPHLLQWQVIKLAKEQGYKYYDFWGIEEHYQGVARFKRGFSGTEVEYPGCFDLPVNKLWYPLYKIIKKFR